MDMYALGTTDGKLYICNKNGKIEKTVDAHEGALLCLQWNYEGSAILTSGEDGQLKIWSRNGMLRSILIQSGFPIYACCWSPDNDQVLYTNGKHLIIKPVQPGKKPTQWKAHEGIILKVDWNLVNNLILSASEDRRYKVWDSFGRQIYSSSLHEHAITSISWSPSGDMFAVGYYNTLKICDKLGWSFALSRLNSGSLFNIAWTPDGTQIACAGGTGSVVFGHLIERRFEWKNYEVTLLNERKLSVYDVLQGIEECFDFRDRIVKISIRFGYLVTATSTQCHIFSEKNWNTPCIIDLSNKGRVTCIQQSSSNFALVDTFSGIQVFSYDGKLLSNPKFPGLRAEFIHNQSISLNRDILAVKDRSDERLVHLFDIHTGSLIGGKPLIHTVDVLELGLSQSPTASSKHLILLDKNKDLFITLTYKPNPKKLGTMIETIAWNDEKDVLLALSDGKLLFWYYPNAIFVDEDIVPFTQSIKETSLSNNVQICQFVGTQCLVRSSDGSLIHISGISPLPGILHEFTNKNQWEEAIRLCRHVNNPELWASLAAMSINGNDLNTAEVAYAAIDQVEKVQYICKLKGIAKSEARAAEIALLKKQPQEAESILLGANLIYKAIRMWLDLFNWDRALEIALKYKTHVDTVLYFRRKYLRALEKQETSKKFLHYAQEIEIDWEKIKEKIALEETLGNTSKLNALPTPVY